MNHTAALNEPAAADWDVAAQLPQHEAYLQLAFEAANLGIWQHDLASDEVTCDPRVQLHYGLSAARVPFADVFVRIHPDDAGHLQQQIAAATRPDGAGKFAAEYRVFHPDGSLHWLQVHVRVLFAEEGGSRRAAVVFGTSQDITGAKAVEERLRGRTEELERILDLLPAAIWIADDPQCMQVSGNAYANALLQVDPDTNVSQSANSGSPVRLRQFSEGRELAADELPMQKAAATGEPQLDIDLRIEQPNGRTVSLIGGAVPLFDAAGRTRGALAAFHDVTARRQVERDLHRTLEELQRSNADLEQFAYAASHDLQEPLRAMSGMVQLLRERYRSQLDARGVAYIDHAVEAAARMQALIGALLAFSRVDRVAGPLEEVDMNRVLAYALANLTVALQEAQAEVVAGPLPQVMADAAQMTQVLQNLVGNAVKFRGSRAPRVEVGATRVDHAWQFHVRDNGIGIDPQYFDRIFVIFQRLHVRREYAGMGIGLALCKKIVERHGGRIWVESAPDAGSTFFFTLPIHREEPL